MDSSGGSVKERQSMQIDHDASTYQDTGIMAVKASLAWLGWLLSRLGIERWSDVAAVLASIYTALLIAEWIYKHVKIRRKRERP